MLWIRVLPAQKVAQAEAHLLHILVSVSELQVGLYLVHHVAQHAPRGVRDEYYYSICLSFVVAL